VASRGMSEGTCTDSPTDESLGFKRFSIRTLPQHKQKTPVSLTLHSTCLLPSKTCRKTYDKNQCQVDRWGERFWTVRDPQACTLRNGDTQSCLFYNRYKSLLCCLFFVCQEWFLVGQ